MKNTNACAMPGRSAAIAEAAIAMMEAGVNHMPVVDAGGRVLGILSAVAPPINAPAFAETAAVVVRLFSPRAADLAEDLEAAGKA